MDELKMPLSLNLIRSCFFLKEITQESLRTHTTTPNIVFLRIQHTMSEYKQMVPPFLLDLNIASEKSLIVLVFSFPSRVHISKLLQEEWFLFLIV